MSSQHLDNPRIKHIRPNNILLLVTGKTPEIITETVFAFIHERNKFIPDEIHIITTEIGRNSLLKADEQIPKGKLHYFLNKLCSEHDNIFKGQRYEFSQKTYEDEDNEDNNMFIHLIGEEQNSICEDIRTFNDSEMAGNTIYNVIKDLSAIPEVNLKVSIAGGRKTMGFYAGYVLSIFSRRRQNFTLHHVLTSELFEYKGRNIDPKNPPLHENEYFYPTREEYEVSLKEEAPIVELATIPIIHFGDLLPESIRRIADYSKAVKRLQSNLSPYRVSFRLRTERNPGIELENDFEDKPFFVKLEQRQLAVYLTILKLYVDNSFNRIELNVQDINLYLKIYRFLEQCRKDDEFRSFKDTKNCDVIKIENNRIVYNYCNIYSQDYVNKVFRPDRTKLKKKIDNEKESELKLKKINNIYNPQNLMNKVEETTKTVTKSKNLYIDDIKIPEDLLQLFSQFFNGILVKINKAIDADSKLYPNEAIGLKINYNNKENSVKNIKSHKYPYWFENDFRNIKINFGSLYGLISPKEKNE